jgi:hypothetical protein
MMWKTSEKRMKQKYKTKWKAITAEWIQQTEDRISELENEMATKEKLKNY